MNRRDALGADFVAWLDNEAQAPVPAATRERVLATMPSRPPRPARVARFGSHWVGEPSRVAAPIGGRLGLPVLGATSAIVLLVIALTLIGAALFVGSHRVQQPPEPGRLAYELGGAIYLADQDGGNPVRVAPGSLASGVIWARDGRHFVFHGDDGAHVSDADGRVVASFDNASGFNGYPTWSPDSTRLQAWSHAFTTISIYGTDGGLQTELSLPEGYTRVRETIGMWAPDGRSVWVRLARPGEGAGGGPGEAWELPIDGSAPGQGSDGLAFMSHDLTFSPDGARMAFTGLPEFPDDRHLYVADADGTGIRPVVQAGDDPHGGTGGLPVWSPTGQQLAYLVWRDDSRGLVDVKVVDVANGTARTLIAGFSYAAWPPYGWSRDGDQILVSKVDGAGVEGLWTVNTDGGDATLLVEGAAVGEWQPASPAAPLH